MLLLASQAAMAGEVFVRCWGATGPYDPPITAPSGTVSKTLSRDSADSVWGWRNYAAATPGGVAISCREGLNGPPGFSTVHQGVLTTAYWTDDITIDSPGLTGQFGVLTLTYRVNGSVLFTSTFNQVEAYNRAYLQSSLEVGTGGEYCEWEKSGFGVTSGSDFMNVDRTVQVEFRFGTPIHVKHTLNGNTAMDSRSATPGKAEIEAATVWKGITVTYQGAPLANFTSSSANVPVWSETLPPPLPKMTSSVEGSEMVFTWPDQARCELTVSADFANWVPTTLTPTVTGVMKTFRAPMSEGQQYFRLRSTP